ncbi:FliM/FliN family flagellar motor C-terminal domain-containing protein [Desulfoscipio sp. XC116]|uniref:FliM/FliN family flagellar motor C-terminal domain-containing protein n=1 Tax=Desulfoscipio sp. XC116 TaxID=3144975 RepID=UPI00325AD78B
MLSQRELDEFLGNFNTNKTTVKKVTFPPLHAEPSLLQSRLPLDFIGDVVVDIKAELGEATLTVREILNMKEGAVVELEKAAGDNINLKVNEQDFARGEVIIIGNNLGIRVDRVNEIDPHVPADKEVLVDG